MLLKNLRSLFLISILLLPGILLPESHAFDQLHDQLFFSPSLRSRSLIAADNLEAFLAAQNMQDFESSIIKLMEQKDAVLAPNIIRTKLAKKWIGNAAFHIFHDPLRSILELAVNACDATMMARRPSMSVGKFGLGFFSALGLLWYREPTWLPEQHGTIMTITTAFRQSEDDAIRAYQIVFDTMLDDMTITFRRLDPVEDINDDGLVILNKAYTDFFSQLLSIRSGTVQECPGMLSLEELGGLVHTLPTGTSIAIEPKHATAKFSESSLSALRDYAYYLDTYPHVKTKLFTVLEDGAPFSKIIGGRDTASDYIHLSLQPHALRITDAGIGMAPQTVLLKLLIPSESTKRDTHSASPVQEPLALPELVEFNGKKDKNSSHFLMTVNGVLVVNRQLPAPIKDKDGAIKDLIMHLPSTTPVTLARNEIEIPIDGKSAQEKSIKTIISKTINQLTALASGSIIDSALIQALFSGLDVWEQQSAAGHIKGRFTGYFKKELEYMLKNRHDFIPVQPACYNQMKDIFKEKAARLLPLDPILVQHNYHRFEKFVCAYADQKMALQKDGAKREIMRLGLDRKLIAGMAVVFVPAAALQGQLVTNFGLRLTLFAADHLLDTMSAHEVANCLIAHMPKQDFSIGLTSSRDDMMLIVTNSKLPLARMTENFNDFFKKSIKASLFNERDEAFLREFFHQHYTAFTNVYWWEEVVRTWDFELFKIPGSHFGHKRLCCDIDWLVASIIENYDPKVSDWKKIWQDYSGFIYDQETRDLYYAQNSDLSEKQKAIDLLITNKASLEDKQQGVKKIIKASLVRAHTSHAQVMGVLCRALLLRYNIDADNKSAVIYVDSKRVWPLQEKSGCALEQLLYPLLSHSTHLISLSFSTWLATDNQMLKHAPKRELMVASGLSDRDINDMLSMMQHDYQWASSVNGYLERGIKNIAVQSYLGHIMPWYVAVTGPRSRLSQHTQQQVDLCKDALLGMYHCYFDIDPNMFPKTYGQTTDILVAPLYSDLVSTAAVENLFAWLEKDPLLCEKICLYMVDDFSRKIDPDLKRNDLKNHCLFVPVALNNTPFSLLAALQEKYTHHGSAECGNAVVWHLLSKAENLYELAFVGHLLLDEQMMRLICQLYTKNRDQLADILGYFVRYYVQEKIDKDTLLAIYEKNRVTPELGKRIEFIAQSSASKALQEMLQDLLGQQSGLYRMTKSFLQPELTLPAEPASDFTLIQLLKAHTAGSGLGTLLDDQKLHEVIKITQAQLGDTKVGKINQNVEMGSEKSPMHAAITELLQNALDASREMSGSSLSPSRLSQLAQIDIMLDIKQAQDEQQHLCLTVNDSAGFPDVRRLLTDFILPDFSSKGLQAGNVGGMGNGLFTVYKQAHRVAVLTRVTGSSKKCYLLIIDPMRDDQTGRVYNLALSCTDVSDHIAPSFVGTSVKVTFLPQDKNILRLDLIALKDFLINCIGATQAQLRAGQPCAINLHNIDGSRQLLNPQASADDILYTYYDVDGERLFRLIKRDNMLLQSYVTTGGVPFRPLYQLSKVMRLLPDTIAGMMQRGYIVDLATSTYKPVQSRTLLQMSDAMLGKIRKGLLDSFYTIQRAQAVMDIGAGKIPATMFSHLDSPVSDFYQVRLSADDNKKFQTTYNDLITNRSWTNTINLRDLFDFYKPLAGQQSFFDHLEAAYIDMIPALEELSRVTVRTIKEHVDAWAHEHRPLLERELAAAAGAGEQDAIRLRMIERYESWKEHELEPHIQLWRSKAHKMLDQWLEARGALWPSDLVTIILPTWLTTKVKNKQPEIPSTSVLINAGIMPEFELESSKSKKRELEKKSMHIAHTALSWSPLIIRDIGKLLNESLQSFCNNFFKALNVPKQVVTSIYYEENQTAGSYNSAGNLLAMNSYHLDLAAHIMLLARIHVLDEKSDDLRQIMRDPAFAQSYGLRPGSASTILHELEHARRDHVTGGDHGHGPHTQADDAYGNRSDFDSCAHSYGVTAIKQGLVIAWIREVKKFISTRYASLALPLALLHAHQYQKDALTKMHNDDKRFLVQQLGLA